MIKRIITVLVAIFTVTTANATDTTDYTKIKPKYKLTLTAPVKATNGTRTAPNLETLKQQGQQGDTKAQILLGMMHDFGQGVPQDTRIAMYWYGKAGLTGFYLQKRMNNWVDFSYLTMASEQGDAEAQDTLGYIYYKGERGVPQNKTKALELWKKSGEQGNKNARLTLEFLQINQQENDRGDFLGLKKTDIAELGDAKAQFQLGVKYFKIKDYKQALYWTKKSVEQGNPYAQSLLGIMYYHGYGVKKDYKKAVELYTLASKQGNAQAQGLLGLMYFTGQGIPQDIEKGLYWTKKSAEQGDTTAKKTLETLGIK